MPDMTGSPDQERTTNRKQRIGLVLIGLGIVLAPLALYIGLSDLQLVAGIGGLLAGVSGLFLYAAAKERSGLWSLIGVMPVFGPFVGFLVLSTQRTAAIVLGGAGLALLMYDSFVLKRFPEDVSWFWGIGLVFLLGGLMALAPARSGKAKTRQSSRSLIYCALIIGAIWNVYFVPNLSIMPKQGRQSEAKANLGGIYSAEMKFYEKHKRFGSLAEIGFEPFQPNGLKYTYRIDNSGRPGTVISPTGGRPMTPDNSFVPAGLDSQGFTATATGHIDNDDTLDQWHVNDLKQNLQYADMNDVHN